MELNARADAKMRFIRPSNTGNHKMLPQCFEPARKEMMLGLMTVGHIVNQKLCQMLRLTQKNNQFNHKI